MLVENLRKISIKKIFEVPTFKKSFPVWKEEIKKKNGTDLNAEKILNIGSDLREIFQKTSEKGRSQTIMSSAGAAWECLVAWYLNLCLARILACYRGRVLENFQVERLNSSEKVVFQKLFLQVQKSFYFIGFGNI